MSILCTGAISCKAALENKNREALKLYVNGSKRSKDFSYIISKAKQRNVPVEILKKEDFQARFDKSGGIALEAEERSYPDLKSVKNPGGLVIYVSGVEDPFNLGSTCRSVYAAGANLLILPRRSWGFSEPTLIKASAGAWEKLPIAMIEDDEELKSWAIKYHLPMVLAARDNAISLFDYTFEKNEVMVIGGAMRGISRTLLDYGKHVYIPYGRDFKNALDTPSAAAVMAFSYTRQFDAGKEKADK